MYDVIIRGGEVVDGTGAARRRADVGIRDGKVVAIGEVSGESATTIDATGKVVAPGFVDVHTHFDAQVFWDGALTPSPLHGVTTVLAGNCGFTIAPLSADPADGEYLMRMLARVEGMPLESLRDGVPWSWTTTPDTSPSVTSTTFSTSRSVSSASPLVPPANTKGLPCSTQSWFWSAPAFLSVKGANTSSL